MKRYLQVLAFSAALVIPGTVNAQSHAQQDNRDYNQNQQNNQQVLRYQDRAHNDSHTWDGREDQAYRTYLQEQRRPYRPFARLRVREQNNYWNWRHVHGVDDRH